MVLEARDRVGGRLLNHPLPGTDHVVEVGGQWIGPTQDRLAALADELGRPDVPDPREGRQPRRVAGPARALPRADPAHQPRRARRRRARRRRGWTAWRARSIPQAPWQAAKAERWDAQTFATWIARNTATRGAATLLEIAVEAVWAAEPADLSLLHVLFYVASAGSFDALIGTEGGAQQDRFVGGSQLVALRLAERLRGPLVLEAPVRAIDQDAGGVTVRADGHSARARAAIVALPPTLTARIAYAPALPAARDQLVQRMPQGTVTKCMAVYDEPFWREEGLSGQGLSVRGPDADRLRQLAARRQPRRAPRASSRDAARASSARGTPPLAATRSSTASGGCSGRAPARPVDYVERSWADEEFTRGCYGCYLPPGAWTAHGHALRAPVGRLHWAGAETATRWSGYMDGAVRSGERAARAVLEQLG